MMEDKPFAEHADHKQHMPWMLPDWVPLAKRYPVRPRPWEKANG